jgi:hypothetical protein
MADSLNRSLSERELQLPGPSIFNIYPDLVWHDSLFEGQGAYWR